MHRTGDFRRNWKSEITIITIKTHSRKKIFIENVKLSHVK